MLNHFAYALALAVALRLSWHERTAYERARGLWDRSIAHCSLSKNLRKPKIAKSKLCIYPFPSHRRSGTSLGNGPFKRNIVGIVQTRPLDAVPRSSKR
jgi:hypothetical protein